MGANHAGEKKRWRAKNRKKIALTLAKKAAADAAAAK